MQEDQSQNQSDATQIEEEKTIPLRKPVELGGVKYTEITLREPTALELSKATKAGNDIDTAIALISMIGKVPRGVAEKLRQRDLQECSDFLGSFTVTYPTTGETSSQS